MSGPCSAPIAQETLVAYWADDLDSAELELVEEHLIGCGPCTAEATRLSAVASALRSVIPPFVDHAGLEALRARGSFHIREHPVLPDVRTQVVFTAQTDLLIHKLSGLDLTRATRVAVTISVEETGQVLLDEPSIPFDRDSGEVLIVCQRHFAMFPPNIVAEVRARDEGGERVTRYPIPHVFEARVI